MYTCSFTTKFKKDFKRLCKRGWNMLLFEQVYELLEKKGELPAKYKAHLLSNNWKGHIDAHIQPDWVLIYKIEETTKEIIFVRMGSHSDLF